VNPADYPTDFLQPLFQFLRTRPEVKAAGLFREVTPDGRPGSYVFMLKATGHEAALEQGFRIVANSACPKDAAYGVTFLRAKNAKHVAVTSQFAPFYAAPGYPAPSPLGGGAPKET
jgi:hypothetical protein